MGGNFIPATIFLIQVRYHRLVFWQATHFLRKFSFEYEFVNLFKYVSIRVHRAHTKIFISIFFGNYL